MLYFGALRTIKNCLLLTKVGKHINYILIPEEVLLKIISQEHIFYGNSLILFILKKCFFNYVGGKTESYVLHMLVEICCISNASRSKKNHSDI